MLKQRLLFLILGLLLMTTKGWAAPMNIELKPGQQQFDIVVKAIPTTGYQWAAKCYDQEQFKLLSSHYLNKANKKPKMGAPLQQVFRFKLLKPLQTSQSIMMALARSWEKQDAKIVEYKIIPTK
jgi:predicted secreted protein